jgi:hypothetical protein
MTEPSISSPPATHTVVMDEQIRDFSSGRKPLKFRIDNDTFEAPADIPAMVLLEFSKRFEAMGDQADTAKYIEAVLAMLEMVLNKNSFEQFRARLDNRDYPISLDQLNEVLNWLMGVYTGRPTEPSESSSDTQATQESGTSSTDDTPALTSVPSL